MKNNEKLNESINLAIEISIRIGFLLLLVAWCFQLLYPFAGMVMWGIILALATWPIYTTLNEKLGGNSKLTMIIYISVGLLLVIIPSWLFVESLVLGIKDIKSMLFDGTVKIPLPPERVESWPLIGNKVYDLWTLASESLESVILKYKDQIIDISRQLFSGAASIIQSLILLIAATIISGILLATKGTDQFARKFFHKLAGSKSDEFLNVFTKTVQNVVKGVIGVAIIQSILIGIGFLLAGIPYAGLWTLLVLIVAILQLPALLVILPGIIYLFSTVDILPATLWAIYLMLAGLSDNFLKPILLGKGAPVPIIVIFIGVIGGFMLSGFIGLFTGAIVLSLGYKLFLAWINDDQDTVNAKTTD